MLFFGSRLFSALGLVFARTHLPTEVQCVRSKSGGIDRRPKCLGPVELYTVLMCACIDPSLFGNSAVVLARASIGISSIPVLIAASFLLFYGLPLIQRLQEGAPTDGKQRDSHGVTTCPAIFIKAATEDGRNSV